MKINIAMFGSTKEMECPMDRYLVPLTVVMIPAQVKDCHVLGADRSQQFQFLSFH